MRSEILVGAIVLSNPCAPVAAPPPAPVSGPAPVSIPEPVRVPVSDLGQKRSSDLGACIPTVLEGGTRELRPSDGAPRKPNLDGPEDASELRRLRAEARRSGEGRIDLGWESSESSGWGWLGPWYFLSVRSHGVVRYELYYQPYGGDALLVRPDGRLVQGLENRTTTYDDGSVRDPFEVIDFNGDGWPDLGETGDIAYRALWEFDPRDQLFHQLEGFGETDGARLDPARPGQLCSTDRHHARSAVTQDCYEEDRPLHWVLTDRTVWGDEPRCELPKQGFLQSTYVSDGHVLRHACSLVLDGDDEVMTSWGDAKACARKGGS